MSEGATPVEVPLEKLDRLFLQKLPGLIPGFEPRAGQVELSSKVLELLNFGGRGLFEAGTGTGKSLAYLIPAALWAKANRKPVIISTFTRTLQAQLLQEELPLLSQLMPLEVALIKGRNNYICRRKLGLLEGDKAEAIRQWLQKGGSGEREDLPVAIEDDIWERMESDTDQSLKKLCPHYASCIYYQARAHAAKAQLIVVNHALLLLDLSLKNQGRPGILPEASRIILDEAHHLETATTLSTETRVSFRVLRRITVPIFAALQRVQQHSAEAYSRAEEARIQLSLLEQAAETGFYQLQPLLGEQTAIRLLALPPEAVFLEELQLQSNTLAAALLKLEPIAEADAQLWLDISRGSKKLKAFSNQIKQLRAADTSACRSLERSRAGASLLCQPIEPGPIFAERTDLIEGLVLTSATLSVGGSLEKSAARLGLPGCVTGIFPSPFNYREQALLALPKDLPDIDSPEFEEAAARLIAQAVCLSQGGAFVLCTSYRFLQSLAARVETLTEGRFPILIQGRSSRGSLLEQFKKQPKAVLFGADSFWEGVSVKGWGLRLVIIPKLPFRPPTEPVAQARYARLKEAGKDPFMELSLPEAILRLRQGFGRLIRARTDTGVVLILDRRIVEARYGELFLKSLPEARRVKGNTQAVLYQLESFFRRASRQ
jgi:ATP-dependent DNA helicase DinG